MSPIIRIGLATLSRVGNICARETPLRISQRSCGWIQDYKPGPYPRTKEEREAAARKYNLILEDYEPYPEDSGYGDYPKLAPVGQDSRDAYEDFDYYYRRRNFGETLHVDYDAHMSDKTNPNTKYRYSLPFMFSTFFAFFGLFVFAAVFDMLCDLHTHQPIKQKQYPKPGVVHYTFEPLD